VQPTKDEELKMNIIQSGGVFLASMLSKSRKIVALLSVIALLVVCIPVTAMAAEDDLTEPTNMVAVDNIPVILYHRIVNAATNEWTDTSLKKFKAHIEYLKDNGYTTLSSEEYVSILKGEEDPPEKPILLTFDDATPDFYTTVLPILEENNMKCVLFVVKDYIGGYGMSEDKLKDIADNHPNVSIESHTKSHGESVWTTSISYEDALNELETNKEYINSITGRDPVLLAYPYGNSSLGARVAAAETGIQYAFKVGYPNDGAYNMGRYYTLNITVKEFANNIGGPAPTKDYGDEDEETAGNIVYSNGFEDESVTGFYQSGDAELSVSTDQKNEGAQSLKIVTTGGHSWDGAQIDASTAKLAIGRKYRISAKVYAPDQPVQLVMQAVLTKAADSGTDYKWIANKAYTAEDTGWSTFEGELDLTTGDYSAAQYIQFVKANDDATNITFYIDDFTVVDLSPAAVYSNDFEGESVADFIQSGDAALSVSTEQKSGGAQSLKVVTTGGHSWDGAQISGTAAKLEVGKKYKISAEVYAPDQPVQLVMQAVLTKAADSQADYKWIANKAYTAEDTGWSTFEGELDLTTGDYSAVQYIQFVKGNNDATNITFYIDDFVITEVNEEPEVVRPPAIPFTPVTFEGDQADNNGGFVGRGGVEKLTVTEDDNHTEGGSKALKVEGRGETWNGPSLNVERYIDQGYEYKVTAWVKLIQPTVAQIALSTQVGNGSGASYNNLQTKNITTDDGWVKFEGTYRYTNMKSDYATIYVESPSSPSASFYIDDISFELTSSEPQDIERDLKPIKEQYEDYFLIGNAISAEDLEGVRLDLLKMHHNVVTAGNAMKPDALQPTKGNFTFDAADEMVNKVLAEGMLMHGHTLVWHSQSPDWLNKDANGNPLSREEALENMRTHIKTVVEHFGNRVISWDVVNEAMNDNPTNPTDWRAALRKSPWYYAVGDDYVEQAFLAAREVLDDHPDWDIKLYYNDYNDDNQNKATAIYSMVKELNDKYAETHPGKKLIDGIGMQAHYNLSTNPENVKLSLEKFASLGVEVSVTELDIMAGSNRQLTEEQEKAQAYLYAQLFKIYKEHADKITRVTFWGMDDGTSWRSDNSPLLFDKNLKAKAAYYAVIDPEKYIEENPPEEKEDAMQSTATYGTPVIDGVIDSIWNSTPAMQVNRYQMAWQGATGTAKALWDESNLYVLVQVNDDQLNKANANAWEQDSIEVFVDENNAKTTYYEADDGQYRVNYDNETSFNPESIAEGFESATAVDGTNYVVEVKIPFKTITPGDNVKIGFDVQINDAKDGSRISVANWNDMTGNGYQDPSVFGILTLTRTAPGSGGSSGSGIVISLDDTGKAVEADYDEESGEISVKVPVVSNSDGSVTADVTDSHIDALVESMKKNAGEKSALRITLDTSSDNVTAKLPADAIDKILSADPEASVTVAVGEYEMIFDSKALETVSKAGNGSVEIKISKVDAEEVAAISPEAAEKIGDRPVYSLSVTNGGAEVSDFNGGALTVSIPYTLAEGEDPNAVLIYYIDSNNNLIPVVSRYSDGMVRFSTPHLSRYAVGYNKVSFNDVDPNDYYFAPAVYFGARGVVEAGDLEPKAVLTRGEAIVLIMKAYGIEPLEDAEDNFSDAEGPYEAYFAKAKAIGLTNGIGNNMIGADLPMTREMMFTMVYNILDIMGELPQTDVAVKDPTSFIDYSELSAWSVDATSALIENGIIEGTGSNALSPKATATRAELITMLYRLLNK